MDKDKIAALEEGIDWFGSEYLRQPNPQYTQNSSVHLMLLAVFQAARAHLEQLRMGEVETMLKDLIAAQPCTAADPNEGEYHKGFFDGVMAYGRIIVNRLEATKGANNG